MFTGLIEETGTIKSLQRDGLGYQMTVNCRKILEEIKIDDSVAVNGVCLTVTAFTKTTFTVQTVAETVNRTTLANLKTGSRVNLERALRLSDRLGGHLVQGHIDATATIIRVSTGQLNTEYQLQTESQTMRYIVTKGSVALDGISLTVAEVKGNTFRVAIIPHTIKSTIISEWQTGTMVNLETDIIGRYVENLMQNKSNTLTLDKLAELGY